MVFFGEVPLPADDLIGLYHPFRDLYAATNPNGIAYKNFLITDPIRQQYPWRELSISLEKQMQLPLWNPYSLTGTPLLANFQSAVFYPLNVLFFILPFLSAWTIQVLLQTILLGLFTFFYLRFLKLHPLSQILGAIAISFCGFTISWYEWNTIVQTFLWLPLILLAKEKLLQRISKTWILMLLFAECSALFAGHIQTFFYMLCLDNVYLLARIIQISLEEKNRVFNFAIRKYLPFLLIGCTIILVTTIQWLPTFQLINLSARSLDQQNWQGAGWFIPWQHLVQFIAPDFFGNPATLNYWGTWNYGELVGYIGIVPLFFSLYGILQWKNWYVRFFSFALAVSLLFALPNWISILPFQFSVPFLSTTQPTRLLSIIDFSLVILAAFGFDAFLKQKNKNIFIPFGIMVLFLACVWFFLFSIGSTSTNYLIAKRNLYLPSLLVAGTLFLIVLSQFIHKKYVVYFGFLFIIIVCFDVLRFSDKFLPFVSSSYVYPSTSALAFLQKNTGVDRILTTDKEILPPNVSIVYELQTIEGYDSLYLKRYGQIIDYDINTNASYNQSLPFNRIVTDPSMSNKLMNFLGVKYVLSLTPIKSESLKHVFTEGSTLIYQNTHVFPRAFFISSLQSIPNKDLLLKNMFSPTTNLRTTAFVEQPVQTFSFSLGNAYIVSYSANNVVMQTENKGVGFLLLTDSWYPTWQVTIDGKKDIIYQTDYNYRGVVVPAGKHTIRFSDNLF